ncbi:hypothetical protein D3Z44_15120 [Lachnospiraceae bacterium]|nr:hypothetical protein [Lachnospiraceae bacterium]
MHKSGNISRKFLTFILKIYDKNFERLQRQSDRQDVAMGAMGLDEYRAKYYGETLEKARANLPAQNTVME